MRNYIIKVFLVLLLLAPFSLASKYGIYVKDPLKESIKEEFPQDNFFLFKNYTDMIYALEKGRVDGFFACDLFSEFVKKSGKDFESKPLKKGRHRYSFLLSENEMGQTVLNDLNKFIKENQSFLNSIREKWMADPLGTTANHDILAADDENTQKRTLKFAAEPSFPPFVFLRNDHFIGLDIDVIREFGKQYGYNIQISELREEASLQVLKSGLIADVSSGMVEFYKERAESISMSDPFYVGNDVLVTKKNEPLSTTSLNENNFSLSNVIYVNFIKENRYKTILKGLGITLTIALTSAFFGIIIGILLCALLCSQKKALSKVVSTCIKFILGIPVLIILMFLYYVVFVASGLSGIVVAIIGFSITFGCHIAVITKTNVDAIPKGQWDAALSLGYKPIKAFFIYIAPQVLQRVLPLYKSQFISLMHGTSVAGFIAVEDLTESTEIIRSLTFQPFAPLILTAGIYFSCTYIFTHAINLIEIQFNPRHRKNILKGIKTDIRTFAKDNNTFIPKTNQKLICIEHLSKSYNGKKVLDNLSTQICQGEIITIIGKSGEGKSTLLRCIKGLDRPTSGNITLFGKNITDDKDDIAKVPNQLGFVFQNFNLFAHMTVVENIMTACRVKKNVSIQSAYEQAMQLLHTVGLHRKALCYPDELSGGQQQRVAIARAMAMETKLILLDEPTSALDPTKSYEVSSVIKLLAARGITMVIVTHEMDLAKDISNRILYIENGSICEEGTPSQIFEHPQKEETRRFVQSLKILDFNIGSHDYDFIHIQQELYSFALRYHLTKKQHINLFRVFEELCAVTIIPQLPEKFNLSVTIEAEKNGESIRTTFQYNGEPFNPFEHGDPISITILKASIKDYSHTFTNNINYVDVRI